MWNRTLKTEKRRIQVLMHNIEMKYDLSRSLRYTKCRTEWRLGLKVKDGAEQKPLCLGKAVNGTFVFR